MKILLIHNHYQSTAPSGEDTVFFAEKKLLEDHGIEVIAYERSNDELESLKGLKAIGATAELIWSKKTYEEVQKLIREHKPDVAHFHNIYYRISPSAYQACVEEKVPVVQTLHNFRFFCVNGLFLRKGTVCEDCIGSWPWRGAMYGCHRDSKIYSAPTAIMDGVHHMLGTWQKNVDAYISLTDFAKGKLAECGLPENKIYVKPNFIPDPGHASSSQPKKNILFLGRLSEEKGVDLLLDAAEKLRTQFNESNVVLQLVGDGPLKKTFENRIKEENLNFVQLLGSRKHGEVIEFVRNARALVMPSIWYEGFPMVLLEAYACGVPVLASKIGALESLIEHKVTGLHFSPGDQADLCEQLSWVLEHERECRAMGDKARKKYENFYTAEKNFQMLNEVYRRVIKQHEHIQN